MKDILQKWLKKCSGLLLEMERLDFYMKDGTIFLKILKHYNIVNSKSVVIDPSQDDEVCRMNLNQLKFWIKLLDINFDDQLIEDILGGNVSSCINVLCQLYLSLENKNSLHFVSKQKERFITNHNEKFKVTELSLIDVQQNEPKYNDNCRYKFSDRILEHNDVIKWYENKHGKKKKSDVKTAFLVPINDKGSRQYSKEATKSITKKKSRFDEDVYYVRNELDKSTRRNSISGLYGCYSSSEISNHNYLEKLNLTSKSKYYKNFKPKSYSDIGYQGHFLPPISSKDKVNVSSASTNNMFNLDTYFKKLKCSFKSSFKRKRVSENFCKNIVSDVWDMVLDMEEDELKSIIACRLLKQSIYEKKLSMKFYQIMHQSEVQKQSYAEIEKHLESNHNEFKGDLFFSDDCGCSISSFNSPLYRDYLLYYQDERKRTVELHRRLYAEKLKLRFQKHYALCYETNEDILNIVVKKSEFSATYEMPVPEKLWNQWKYLFQRGLPVFDIEDLCYDTASEFDNTASSVDLNRQSALNEYDLDNYLDVQREWYKLFDEDSENVYLNNYAKNMENQFVVGYIVHRLLGTKYPCQPPPKPANIPKYPFRVVLNEVNDETVIKKLTSLLTKSQVLVIDVNSAVNFCLQCFKDELGDRVIEVISNKRNNKSSFNRQGSEGRKSFHSVGVDAEKVNKEVEEELKAKGTQTSSSTLINEDIVFPFEEAAALGRELFNAMLIGNELSTYIIVNILIEYIKSKSNIINGWVLVNFPSTLFQASVLEYALTSKKFPYHLEDDTASVFDSDKDLKDMKDNSSDVVEVEIKSSRIVPNPRECTGEDVFKTYFSKFITANKGEVVTQDFSDTYERVEHFEQLQSESTLLLEHPEREGVPSINEFYREQGISYDFVYEVFDVTTIKVLARLILYQPSEDVVRTDSVELFGEDVLDKLVENDNLRDVVLCNKPVISLTKAVRNVLASSVSEYIDFNPSSELEHHRCSEECSESNNHSDKRDTLTRPGDRNWIYANNSIVDNVAVALATFWENLETVYLYNLKDVFFLKRNTDYALIPYINYVTKIEKACFNQIDDRQDFVAEFLNQFNSIHQVLRSDEEMKYELHLRVIELKEKLLKLCEDRRDSSLEMREKLINQNWTFLQMASIGNRFISMLQIEAERCLRTLDLLKDYYYAMLGSFKLEPVIDGNVVLSKIELDVGGESEENIIASEIINCMFTCDDSVKLENPVYDLVENHARNVCSVIEKSKSVLDNVISVEENSALKVHRDLYAAKMQELSDLEKKMKQNKESKKKSRSKSKDEEANKLLSKKMEDLKEEGNDKENSLKNIFVEWNSAVKGEVDRTLYRIEMIKKKAFVDLTEIENNMAYTFRHFHEAVMTNFNTESICIEQLCLLFQLAIEEKTPIFADIVFYKNQLLVTRKIVEKAETIVKLPPALEEMLFEESFTIRQLEAINERLKYVAPNGIISQQSFVSLIETMMLQGANNGSMKLVPNIWEKLKQGELSLLFQKVFGDAGLIEWRDFLIYCLDLPYPLMEDIVDAKLQFLRHDVQETEAVSYDDYMSTTLWFHRELPETPLLALHNVLAKEFLFSLYKIEGENLINYTSLLLGFCKDKDLKIGFGKGVSLLYGRCVIIYEEDLYLEQILTDHINTGGKIVNCILDEIIRDVIETNYGVLDEKIAKAMKYREQELFGLENTSQSSFQMDGFDQLTESMYDQFFRRHLFLQWTSRVPYLMIVSLLTIAFYPVLLPYYVYESYSHIFEELRLNIKALQESGEHYVYSPNYFNQNWLEGMLKTLNKFKAVSLTNVIKEIISNRKED